MTPQQPSPPDRSKYLSLGFLAQRVLTDLVRIADGEPTPTLHDSLIEAHGMLARTIDLEPSDPSLLPSYQEVRTVSSVSDQREVDRVLEIIKELQALDDLSKIESIRQDIDRAISWFGRLQGEALSNYSSDVEPLPVSIRELCRTT